MSARYRDKRTERFSRRQHVSAFSGFAKQAAIKLRIVESARSLATLSILPGNRFEALKDSRSGQYSIRINDQWRICFEWSAEQSMAVNIEIVDYHQEAPMTAAFDPIHPGDVLAEQLDALDMSTETAARALGIPESHLSEILAGHQSITADMALRLSRWLNTDVEFWMNLQTHYDIDTARDEHGDLIDATVIPLATSAA